MHCDIIGQWWSISEKLLLWSPLDTFWCFFSVNFISGDGEALLDGSVVMAPLLMSPETVFVLQLCAYLFGFVFGFFSLSSCGDDEALLNGLVRVAPLLTWSDTVLVSVFVHVFLSVFVYLYFSVFSCGDGGALLDGLVGVAPLLMWPQFPQICRQSIMNKGEIFPNDVCVRLLQIFRLKTNHGRAKKCSLGIWWKN